jgi:hypothetical protein
MDRPNDVVELFVRKENGRYYTLSVDFETYDIISKAAKATGKSKPSVLAAFVATANSVFAEKAIERGIPLDRIVSDFAKSRKRGRPYSRRPVEPESVNIDSNRAGEP